MSDGSAVDRERWQRIDDVFAAALEQPAERRAEFLDRACGGDADLRREVESLLLHDRDDGFLATAATAEAQRLLGETRSQPLAGGRLGRFEVLGKLGAGGMGEVYLAHDPKLERRVAIKLLPRHLAADPDRIRRFRREVLAVSALNHPNILTVHEIVEVDGNELMVSELVAGVTLRERLGAGPLPLAAALEVGAQIAAGLAAAHGVGIVHRDVKPENVMIRGDGLVKLLDFGIAKSPATGPADLTHSPTRAATGTGVILGTASYMSPEQARGEPAGGQADIWALGCVLFEALTGRQAFPGPTVSDVLAAILTREPDWEALPADTPGQVRSLLRRCLQKNPEQRLRDAGDARLELEEAIREPTAAGAARVASRRRRWPRVLAWSAAAAGAAALALLALLLARAERPRPILHGRFELQPPPGVALEWGEDAMLAISPDGRSVAFSGTRAAAGTQLFLRAVEELEARAIPGTEGAINPFFSPDARWLAFHSRGAIRKVPLAGGEPLVVCEAPTLRGASWGEDGTIVFSGGEGLLQVAAAGGRPQVLTTAAGHRRNKDRWPHHLPGGRAVLFLRSSGGIGEANQQIAVRSLVTGDERVLVRGGTYPRYAAGQLVISRLGTLYAAPFDPERGELAGELRPVLDNIAESRATSAASFDLSPTGSLVFSPGWPRPFDGELVRVDRQGKVTVVAERRADYDHLVLPSPDGRMLAVFIASSLEEADLWTYELATGRWGRLTADGNALTDGAWSHDGRSIFFPRLVDGVPKAVRIAIAGGRPPERLTTAPGWEFPAAITPDDRLLLFQRSERSGTMDFFTLDLEGDRVPRPFLATAEIEENGDLSPDGRWVSYQADSEGTSEIYVRPFPGPGLPVKVSTGGGQWPRWSVRGDEIFYRCPQSAEDLCAAPVRNGERLTVGAPRALFAFDPGLPGSFTVSHDGMSFYMVRYPPAVLAARRIVYAPGWIDELAGPR